jgi:hypothetical protein
MHGIPAQLKRLIPSVIYDVDKYDGYNLTDKLALFSPLGNRLPNLEALLIEGFKIGK